LKRSIAFGNACYSIHNSWTEVLTGTHFVLTLMSSQDHQFVKIERIHLARMVIITASQLVEMMFKETVDSYIEQNSDKLCKCCLRRIESDNKKQIGIEKAMKTWTPMLIGESQGFDFNQNTIQAYNTLRFRRNETIHNAMHEYSQDFANSAYYTALKTSEEIWEKFFPDKQFVYAEWVKKMPASTDVLFNSLWDRYQNEIKRR